MCASVFQVFILTCVVFLSGSQIKHSIKNCRLRSKGTFTGNFKSSIIKHESKQQTQLAEARESTGSN